MGPEQGRDVRQGREKLARTGRTRQCVAAAASVSVSSRVIQLSSATVATLAGRPRAQCESSPEWQIWSMTTALARISTASSPSATSMP